MTLAEHKTAARLALESLVAQCQREIRNLERFDDARCLIATADLWRSYNQVEQDAYELAEVFAETQEVSE